MGYYLPMSSTNNPNGESKMYELYNDMTGSKISRHRTPRAAFLAMRKVSRDLRRREGGNTYLPMTVLDEDGEIVSQTDYDLHI